MQYLVTGEYVEPGPLLSPDQLVGMRRMMILQTSYQRARLLLEAMQSERGLERLSLRQSPMKRWTLYCTACPTGGW